ncbi:hypothetical protein ACX9I7_00655 [Streptomyces sp. L500]
MNISTPSGLITGPAGGCSSSFCCNAATRVLVHLAAPASPRDEDVTLGAFCAPCTDRHINARVAPREVYQAAALSGEIGPGPPLPHDTWAVRKFTPGEAAEMSAIHRGELLYGRIAPGTFGWRTRP